MPSKRRNKKTPEAKLRSDINAVHVLVNKQAAYLDAVMHLSITSKRTGKGPRVRVTNPHYWKSKEEMKSEFDGMTVDEKVNFIEQLLMKHDEMDAADAKVKATAMDVKNMSLTTGEPNNDVDDGEAAAGSVAGASAGGMTSGVVGAGEARAADMTVGVGAGAGPAGGDLENGDEKDGGASGDLLGHAGPSGTSAAATGTTDGTDGEDLPLRPKESAEESEIEQ